MASALLLVGGMRGIQVDEGFATLNAPQARVFRLALLFSHR